MGVKWWEGRHIKCIEMSASVHWSMLSPSAIGQIKAEIARLEEARKQCSDPGIVRVIEGWIEEQKRLLAQGTKKDS